MTIAPETDSNVYEVYLYMDENAGYGKAGTATYIRANSLDEAKKLAIAANYDMYRYGVKKMSSVEISETKISLERKIFHFTMLLETLNKIS